MAPAAVIARKYGVVESYAGKVGALTLTLTLTLALTLTLYNSDPVW